MVMIMEKLDASELLEHLVEQEVRAVSHVRVRAGFSCATSHILPRAPSISAVQILLCACERMRVCAYARMCVRRRC